MDNRLRIQRKEDIGREFNVFKLTDKEREDRNNILEKTFWKNGWRPHIVQILDYNTRDKWNIGS